MFAFLFFFRMASTTYLWHSTTLPVTTCPQSCINACQPCFSQRLCSKGALADLVGDIIDVLAAIAGADGVAEADLNAAQPSKFASDK